MRSSGGKTVRGVGQEVPLTGFRIRFVQRAALAREVSAALASISLAESSTLLVAAIASFDAAVVADPVAGAQTRMVDAKSMVGAVVVAVRDRELSSEAVENVICVAVEQNQHVAGERGDVFWLRESAEAGDEPRLVRVSIIHEDLQVGDKRMMAVCN